jgi:hypothetical protein
VKDSSSSDTPQCGFNIQKGGATILVRICLESSNFALSKTHGAVSRAGSRLEAKKRTEKCVQELCVTRKGRHAGLDPAELQQIIHVWDSDTEGDRNEEFPHGSNSLNKDVMPQHEEVVKSSLS